MKPIANIEKIMSLVMKLETATQTFSGFYVKFKNGYAIMTAKHAVKDFDITRDRILDASGKYVNLKITEIVKHPTRDLALLKFKQEMVYHPLPYTVSEQKASLLQEVLLLGYPNGESGTFIPGTRFLTPILRDGIVAARSGKTSIALNITSYPGDSGGMALAYNDKGELFVVGVLVSYWVVRANKPSGITDNMAICDVEECWDFLAAEEKK